MAQGLSLIAWAYSPFCSSCFTHQIHKSHRKMEICVIGSPVQGAFGAKSWFTEQKLKSSYEQS